MEPRVDWVSSSSAYKKEEIDQPGAPRAKKITKVIGSLVSPLPKSCLYENEPIEYKLLFVT